MQELDDAVRNGEYLLYNDENGTQKIDFVTIDEFKKKKN